MGDQQLDDIEVAVASGPLHWGCYEVATQCIDFGPLIQKITTSGDLGVYCSPVKWGDVLVVTIRCLRLSRVDELSDEINVATLGSDKNACLRALLVSEKSSLTTRNLLLLNLPVHFAPELVKKLNW